MEEEEFSYQSFEFRKKSEDCVELFQCSDTNPTVTIPSTVFSDDKSKLYRITNIASHAFIKSRSKTVNFSQDSCLDQINDFAFYDSYIEKVFLPKNFRTILPNSLFTVMTSKIKVVFPEEGKYFIHLIDGSAYRKFPFELVYFQHRKVKRLLIRESTTKVFSHALLRTQQLSYINIPASVTEIGSWAFAHCSNLKRISFSKDSRLKIIGDFAFAFTNLKKVNFPPSLELLCNYSFFQSPFIEKLSFPSDSKLQIIGDSAFDRVKNLRNNIKFPLSLKKIGKRAFAFINPAKAIEFMLDSSLVEIEESSFENSNIRIINYPKVVSQPQNIQINSEQDKIDALI